jgi:hypothetical protein
MDSPVVILSEILKNQGGFIGFPVRAPAIASTAHGNRRFHG